VRQQAIAAAFGVGAVVDAYNYAYVIPGFLLVLLGGINGQGLANTMSQPFVGQAVEL
jgi:peptidoglycan biosynthesis protein MviN/MurJ (putative lipid II flippase)